jgi:hypothetical protein
MRNWNCDIKFVQTLDPKVLFYQTHGYQLVPFNGIDTMLKVCTYGTL